MKQHRSKAIAFILVLAVLIGLWVTAPVIADKFGVLGRVGGSGSYVDLIHIDLPAGSTITGSTGTISGGGTLSGSLADDIALDGHKITGVTEVLPPIEIGSCIDGTVAPGPLATLSATGGGSIVMKDTYRDFGGAAGATVQDVYCNFTVPFDLNATTTTFTVRFKGYVTDATAPAAGEGVTFGVACFTLGDNESLGGTVGTEVLTSRVFGGTWAQYANWTTGYSTAVTCTGVAAGERAIVRVRRLTSDAADTYAKPIGLTQVRVRYSRSIQ